MKTMTDNEISTEVKLLNDFIINLKTTDKKSLEELEAVYNLYAPYSSQKEAA